MSNDRLEIRQSKKKQYGYVLLTGLLILFYFIGPYNKTRIMYEKNPIFTIILGVIFFSIFIFFLFELIKRKPEIILTSEGLELRDRGFYEWSMISSFKTIYYRGTRSVENEDLILHFKEFADMKFDISHLEKNRADLVNLILKYKGTSGVFYVGHETKKN